MRRPRSKGYIIVTLTDGDFQRLTWSKPIVGHGGRQDMIRRLQNGVKGQELKVALEDLPRIARHWYQSGYRCKPGSGGWQNRLPMESLRQHLPPMAPLFREHDGTNHQTPTPVYFTQEVSADAYIKIGLTVDTSRRGGGFRTDNPRELRVLLWTYAPADFSGPADHYFHEMFPQHRLRPGQEWFRPHEDIFRFIRETRAHRIRDD